MSGFNHGINIWQWWKKKTLPFIAIIIKIGFYETELILMGIGCISSVFNFSASDWCLLLCLLPQHLQITSNYPHLFPDAFLSPHKMAPFARQPTSSLPITTRDKPYPHILPRHFTKNGVGWNQICELFICHKTWHII